MNDRLSGKTVLLGVTGGIAAYKAAELVRMLKKRGAGVHVVMTGSATRFVTPMTFAALSGNAVRTDLFDEGSEGRISHIELSARADVLVIAPATANIIGKMAGGIADDLLSTLVMAARCPVVIAPSMNCRMYESPALQRNIGILKADGVVLAGPDSGPMACNEYGIGRMSEPGEIVAVVEVALARSGRLSGKKVLVTAGPTFEDMDPVRFIGNRSSGKMGYAVAAEAVSMGADVTLVTGPVAIEPPQGALVVRVRSAEGMHDAVIKSAPDADIIIMAAAVADYTPERVSGSKIKKTSGALSVKMVKTKDILAALGKARKKGQVLVGFAAETDDIEKNALKKLKEKRLDLIAANPVGGETGFGSDYNILRIYGHAGLVRDTGKVTKRTAAAVLIDCISEISGF
jgi:phosphopantothenoylcysteine decarboxylase/phosphopantothenate--cysteine ligase